MSIDNNPPFIKDLVEGFNTVQSMVLPEEPTVAQNITAQLTKVLILTCASYYEQQLQNAYTNYAQRESERYLDKPHSFDNFRKEKSVYQKFDFGKIDEPDDKNQLPELRKLLDPLKFFGVRFKDKIHEEVKSDPDKELQAKAFQEIFAIRNLIAHQAFVSLTGSSIRGKSFLDIKTMHDNAQLFVNYLISKFT